VWALASLAPVAGLGEYALLSGFMKFFRSRLSIACVTAAAALGVLAAPAAARYPCRPPPDQKQKCSAGRGNGSEGCDPGNSSTSADGTTGQNQGGDEGGPIQGGTGAP
jgi:hypothetical protein